MARLTCLGFIMQGGLSSAAVLAPSGSRVSQARRYDNLAIPVQNRVQRNSMMLATQEPSAEEDDHPVDPVKAREIMGFKDEEFRMRKFGQLVVLPLAVCFALVLLLRRGFLS